MHKIIAIDGPSASGKGTLSRGLAEALNFAHMDTGALYRAVGYEVLQSGGNPEDEGDALAACAALKAKISDPSTLNNPDLRNEQTGAAASKVAAVQSVRDFLLNLQREFAESPGEGFVGAVLDGRDIGTVICPDAPLKLYITASADIRAKRRMKELQSKGLAVTYEAVLKDMRERDARDAGRKDAPMKPAGDAIVIDSSDLNAGEMLEQALKLAKERL